MQHKVLKYEQANNMFCMGAKVNDRTEKNNLKIQWQFPGGQREMDMRQSKLDSNYYFYSW